MRFYQQLLERALPFLRRDNRFWDVDDIRSRSDWNDDTKKWTLPEDALRRVALPPAGGDCESSSYTAPARVHVHSNNTQSLPPSPNNNNNNGDEESCGDTDFLIRKLHSGDNQTIVDSYFRPKRAKELIMRHSNSSNSNRSRNMLNKMLTDSDLFPSPGTKSIGRTILPTNHSNFSAFTAKLKNI